MIPCDQIMQESVFNTSSTTGESFSTKYYAVAYTVDTMGRLSPCEKNAFLGENCDFGAFSWKWLEMTYNRIWVRMAIRSFHFSCIQTIADI